MKAFYPTADELMAADRDQFDGAILRHLRTYEGGGTVHQQVGGFNRNYYVRVMEGNATGLGSLPTQPEYGARQPEVSRRVQEAFQRLVTKGYLMHNPDQPVADWFLITSDGEEFLKRLARYEQWEKLGVDRVKADLIATGGTREVGGGPGVADMAWDWVRMKENKPPLKAAVAGAWVLVADSRLDELRALKSPDFDFRKLIRLCEELNIASREECHFATAALTRALVDHVPPLFGKKNFSEVANNYAGARSFREAMEHLDSAAKKVADGHLHTQIRKSETLPTAQQVNFASGIDVLLAEIVRIKQ